MNATLRHRGPDGEGYWSDPAAGVGLAHRRLSIIDLSPTGRQPMVSSCERLVIAYNGEFYNHQELRHDLEKSGRRFRGRSDTEVLVEAIAEWGMPAALSRLVGMFAIALWDRVDRRLTLIRDRLGVKPLYWTIQHGVLLFGSELKALRAVAGWEARLDRDSVATFLRHGYIGAPHTILRNVQKLEPGTMLIFGREPQPILERYWDLRAVAARSRAHCRTGTEHEVLEELEHITREAVRCRMIADVPIGALLSGGVDSSLITALMQTIGSQPTKTFSIGFPETDFDEAPYAKAVAAHLGTEHTELYVDARDALALIPELTTYYDEPFADSSQIPTLLVSRLTRRHVAVVLSGDGGDELFGGYTRYRTGAMLARRLRLLPPGTRGFAGTLLRTLPERFWDAAFRLMPQRLRVPQAGRKIHKLADGLRMLTPDAMYRRILSQWPEPDAIVVGGREHRGALWDPDLARIFPDFLDRIQISDTLTYLPDDILTKIDRPSMAYGLEARVPLLDHRLVEFAWRSPAPFKIRGNVSKWSLRQILYRYIPAHLVDRPKMGFGVPLDNWLRGDLRAWADSLLASERLARQGLLRVRPVRDMWETHVAGENWAYPIWNVLILRDSLSHHNVQ